jgi:hypothetical protein
MEPEEIVEQQFKRRARDNTPDAGERWREKGAKMEMGALHGCRKETSSSRGGKDEKQEHEKHTRGRNVMPTEREARIRHRGAGSLIGRNRGRSRLDRNDWCRAVTVAEMGMTEGQCKKRASSVPSCTMHTRGRNVMPTEREARIRHRGAGSLIVRDRNRSRLDRNGWCQGRYRSGNGYESRAVKEGSSSVPSCTMHIGNGTEKLSNKGGKERKQEEKHTRGRNVMPTEMEARIQGDERNGEAGPVGRAGGSVTGRRAGGGGMGGGKGEGGKAGSVWMVRGRVGAWNAEGRWIGSDVRGRVWH